MKARGHCQWGQRRASHSGRARICFSGPADEKWRTQITGGARARGLSRAYLGRQDRDQTERRSTLDPVRSLSGAACALQCQFTFSFGSINLSLAGSARARAGGCLAPVCERQSFEWPNWNARLVRAQGCSLVARARPLDTQGHVVCVCFFFWPLRLASQNLPNLAEARARALASQPVGGAARKSAS